MQDLLFLYSDDFGERVIRNMINDPSFCKTCALLCDFCKYGVYSFVGQIRSAVRLEEPSKLPSFIDEPEEHLPKKIPKADICIISGLHQDLMLALPNRLKGAGVKGLIAPIEDSRLIPTGVRQQLDEICADLGIDFVAPKPFCGLVPVEGKPIINEFISTFNIGAPELEITTKKRGNEETISGVAVRRSAPCGSTWYVAKRILHKPVVKAELRDIISKSHHSFPCTASMVKDPEIGDAILHVAGYLIREAVETHLY